VSAAARWTAALALVLLAAGCTPSQVSPASEAASPTMHENTLLTSDGLRLPLREWLPEGGQPNAVVIALHGFNDHSNFFDGIGRWLAAREIASYAYDQRGFGAAPGRGVWPGTAALTGDLGAAVEAVRARHPGVPVTLFGESMGGAVVMVALAAPDPPAVDGAILAAPAVWGRSTMPWYQTLALWAAARTFPSSRLSGAGLGIAPSDNIEMLRALGRDPLVIKQTRVDAVWGLVNLMDEAMAAAPSLGGSVLVLYGERDELIPPDAMGKMLARLPASPRHRVAIYPDGWHMLIRDRQAETVWRDIEAWITDSDAPLPSGADGRTAGYVAAGHAEVGESSPRPAEVAF